MATHKVPQDVETDDKLIGFLSLKQFIFVVVGLGFGWLTFFFATQVNIILAVIWVPFTVIPLVLGLYQRKDQPVEVFLASAIRYYIKPRKRKWDQEGYFEKVIVTAPPVIEHNYTKSFTGEEAVGRLQNLSRMMDSRGWASKLDTDWQNPQLAETAASESRIQTQTTTSSQRLESYMQPADVMDESSSVVAQTFQTKIASTDTSARTHAMQTMQAARAQPTQNDSGNSSDSQTAQTQRQSSSITPATTNQQASDDTASVQKSQDKTVIDPTPPKQKTPQPITDDDGSVEISLH